MSPLFLLAFLKGPIGLALIGTTVVVATAVTGVAAGPAAAQAVMERVNATPAPTPEPTAAPTAKPKVIPVPPVATATRLAVSPVPYGAGQHRARHGIANGTAGGRAAGGRGSPGPGPLLRRRLRLPRASQRRAARSHPRRRWRPGRRPRR